MNYLRRAFASTARSYGKTVLLLLIIFILGCVISGAISVQRAVQNTDENLRATLPAVVTVELDMDAIDESVNQTGEWPETDALSADILSEVGNLPQVKNYDFSILFFLVSQTLERVLPDQNSDEFFISSEGEGPDSDNDFVGATFESFDLKGMQNDESIDIEEGVIEITSGRMFTQGELDTLTYAALISESFAQLNGLFVGSTLTLNDIVWGIPDDAEMTGSADEDHLFAQRSYDFEVIGIFRPAAEIDTGEPWLDNQLKNDLENRIYVPNTVARASAAWQHEQLALISPEEAEDTTAEDMIWFQNVFALHDSRDIPDFRIAVEDIAPDFFTVVDAGGNFAGVEATMDSLGGLADVILWIAVGASVLILSLLITLFLRERRREMGIYLALGESRLKVVAQMMMEILAIALVAVTLSLFVGNILAATISETMLRNDLAVTAQEFDSQGISFGGVLDQMGISTAAMPTEDIMASYNVALDTATILSFFAAAIGTVIIATIIPMFYILRLNPRKIMM